MLASRYFKIKRNNQDDWFDTILDAYNLLFLDPFFIFKEKEGSWASAHDEIIKHFDKAFLLIAQGNLNPDSGSSFNFCSIRVTFALMFLAGCMPVFLKCATK